MQLDVEEHVIYRIANAPLREYPFPHLYVESVFPPEFYAALRLNWPSASQLVQLAALGRVPEGAYPERFVMPLRDDQVRTLPGPARELWSGLAQWMILSDRLLYALIDKFEAQVRQRLGAALEHTVFRNEVLVVRDHTNYEIGPHTDAPHRLLSLLFYCPDDERYAHLGTSIYAPIDPTFRCPGGPHYPHDRFRKIATMAYKPNALFAFLKTDHSFHGVDPIRDENVLRDLILYDIQIERTAPAVAVDAQPPAEVETARGTLGTKILKNILRGRK
jgi:hypothetical protein